MSLGLWAVARIYRTTDEGVLSSPAVNFMWEHVRLVKITAGVRGCHVVPRVRTAVTQRYDVVNGRGHEVREPQPAIDWTAADPANPSVEFEKD